jgi:AcrR family transcriptional regulator
MARTRTIPDALVLAGVRRLLDEGGTRAASFRNVARAAGLAPATLVQRYGSAERMVAMARAAGWDAADAALAEAEAAAPMDRKGAVALLKALPQVPVPDGPRAQEWRAGVEAALAARLGGKEQAAILFAAWAGRQAWTEQGSGEKGFSLRDLVKRLD